MNGHSEIVKLLLANDKVDPSAKNNWAIKSASQNGHLEIVKLLLANDKVDPSADNNYAIRFASKNGHYEIVNLLLPLQLGHFSSPVFNSAYWNPSLNSRNSVRA